MTMLENMVKDQLPEININPKNRKTVNNMDVISRLLTHGNLNFAYRGIKHAIYALEFFNKDHLSQYRESFLRTYSALNNKEKQIINVCLTSNIHDTFKNYLNYNVINDLELPLEQHNTIKQNLLKYFKLDMDKFFVSKLVEYDKSFYIFNEKGLTDFTFYKFGNQWKIENIKTKTLSVFENETKFIKEVLNLLKDKNLRLHAPILLDISSREATFFQFKIDTIFNIEKGIEPIKLNRFKSQIKEHLDIVFNEKSEPIANDIKNKIWKDFFKDAKCFNNKDNYELFLSLLPEEYKPNVKIGFQQNNLSQAKKSSDLERF